MNDPNDELVHKLKAGNTNAFDEIFRKYYKLLCYEARGYFKDNFLIEEIVCDVFTRVWQNRERISINTSLKVYLVKAVHNNCIDYYRMQKNQEKISANFDQKEKKAYSLMDIGQNPLDYTVSNDLEKYYLEAVETLPARYKQAFKLSRFEDLTYEEIAVEMGISVNGVKMNIKKALEHLRIKLSDYIITIFLLFSSLF